MASWDLRSRLQNVFSRVQRILEQIFLYLPGQDIIKMEAVSRCSRDVFRDSPALQYQRNLFSAGLSDNLCVSCDMPQQRKAYEAYVRKWSDAGRAVRNVYNLPRESFSQYYMDMIFGCSFPVDGWVPPFVSFVSRRPGAKSQSNGRHVNIHLFHRKGVPCCTFGSLFEAGFRCRQLLLHYVARVTVGHILNFVLVMNGTLGRCLLLVNP
ncbi:hypothetical protein BDM02DRAFT_1684899 [Thelephora ganbajun]|uniref:Uncharacterized protein n=1 Tax=Thelephora ganbajun TaxID=370292 RepID=A0ACB6ZKB1_THEGA|nr:hypothetical protein BDM02DRAFT_1684899 [Thelephora ganbajun]